MVNQMSDDLISRKNLIENLNKFALEHYNALVNDLIMKEPIAFDKAKVIEELKNKADDSRKYWSEFDEECTFGEMNAYTRAIVIVEKGGIE